MVRRFISSLDESVGDCVKAIALSSAQFFEKIRSLACAESEAKEIKMKQDDESSLKLKNV